MPKAFLVRNRRYPLTPPPSVDDEVGHHPMSASTGLVNSYYPAVASSALASLLFASQSSTTGVTHNDDLQDEPEDLSITSKKMDEDEPQDLSLPSSRRTSIASSTAFVSPAIQKKNVMSTPIILFSPPTIASFAGHSLMSPPNSLLGSSSSSMDTFSPHGMDSNCSSSSSISSSSMTSPGMTEPHVCIDCGKRYSTSSNLARHRQTHRSVTDKKARKCPHCEKVYVSMPAYSMHVRTHSQGCQCKFCGKCFSRPWLLQGHIRTHTGEKPFKCNICTKAFADKSNLRAHVQTHSTTKPYSCERCGKAFALKSYLYKHEESSCMRLHKRSDHTQRRGSGSNISHIKQSNSLIQLGSMLSSSPSSSSSPGPQSPMTALSSTPAMIHPRKACLLHYNTSLMQLQSLPEDSSSTS